jgi:hypothetical protein
LLSSGEGIAMLAALIYGVAAGVGLGLARFKILALLPAILIVAAGTIGSDLATGLEHRFIALTVLVAVVSAQIAYLVSFLVAGFIVAKYLRVRAMSNMPVLVHAMQTEIGGQLRTALELPKQLPREMAVLLAQMNARERSRKN